MKITSRQQARAEGLPRYFTGEACLRGHVAERHVGNNECSVCRKESARAYYIANKEALDAAAKQRYEADKERINARQVRYNTLHKSACAAAKRRHGLKHRQRISAQEKQRFAVDAMFAASKKANSVLARAKKLNRAPAWLTEHDLLVMECRYAVALMLTRVNGIPWSVDHVIPYKGKLVSGLHVPNNLQWLPLKENQRKTNAFDPGGGS
jgi:hypothetical protein